MKKEKAARAITHLDDDLIVGAMQRSDMTAERRRSMKHKNASWTKWVTLAAAVVLVFSAVLLAGALVGNSGAVIALDVNPSIEIEVDSREKVKEVRALNEDAKVVLGTMNFKGVDLDMAINAIVGSMVTNGYLTDAKNSILVSIDAKNTNTVGVLQEKLSAKVAALLGEQNIEAAVITQRYENDKETDRVAVDNSISLAKAALIRKIVAAELLDAGGVPYTYTRLATLSVNELKQILDAKNFKVDGLRQEGNASTAGYISVEDALERALAKASLSGDAAASLKTDFDFDDDHRVMVYEIEFVADNLKYEYEINAKTGDILDEEIEPRDKDDNDEDDDDHNVMPPADCTSREAALSIAYTDAGVSAGAVRRPEIELEREGNLYVYEIEFKANGNEYEYKLNAVTGEILKKEVEKDD